jgi:4-alpha-glucanotransferase
VLQTRRWTRPGADWRNWPKAWHDPYHPEVEAFAVAYPARVEFHAFRQWLSERSLRAQDAARSNGMAIGLIADLAVGADGAGSQAWSRQDELLADLKRRRTARYPQPRGAGLGHLRLLPEGLKRNGYRAFIEMLRANLAHAGGLRIDHVMGLRRLWLIPVAPRPAKAPTSTTRSTTCCACWPWSRARQAIILGETGHRARRPARAPGGQGRAGHARAALRAGLARPLRRSSTGRTTPWPPPAPTTWRHWPAGWQARDIDWNNRLQLIDAATEEHWRASRALERRPAPHPGANYGPLRTTTR